LSRFGVQWFQRSFVSVGMMTSFTSGLPRRETCDQRMCARPLALTFTCWRSVVDQMPITWLFVSSSEIGI
jgi:hypothetical protein